MTEDDTTERSAPESGSDDVDDAAADAGDADAGTADAAASSALESISGTRAEVPGGDELEAAIDRATDAAAEGAAPAPAETLDPDVAAGEGVAAGLGGAGLAGGETARSAEAAAGTLGIAGSTAGHEDATRVLEFTLGDDHYCLDIEYIEEIVKQETITRVPNTAEFVEGVVDLRGQITTILNPKVAMGKADRRRGSLIVVFDDDNFDDQGSIGWIVDDVRQVTPIVDEQVNEAPMDDDHVEGVVDRDEDDVLVIWTSPDLGLGGVE